MNIQVTFPLVDSGYAILELPVDLNHVDAQTINQMVQIYLDHYPIVGQLSLF